MRPQGLLWLNAALSVIPASLLAGAAVEGRVELPKSRAAPVQAKRYEIVTKAGVLSTQPPLAVIYLDGNFSRPASLPTKEVEQKDLTFIPALLPIRVGTRVEFPNLDDDYHNVFSYSKVKRFDLGRYKKDEKPASQKFDRPGVVKLYCEIHEHMRSTILVLDTPYFQKTDATGKFRLNDIPAGHYKLKAWLDEDKVLEQEIEVKEGQPTLANFDSK